MGDLRSQLQAVLDDPATAARPFSHPQAGDHRVDEAIGQFVLGDVLIHTWDLACAVGLDETLDAEAVHAMREGIVPIVGVLSASGHYDPPAPVADDADEQTRLLALTGRRP